MPEKLKNKLPLSESHYAAELRRALQDKGLQDLLQGEIGSFSTKFLFINEYINYINLIESNPRYIPIISSSKGFKFNAILTLIKKIAERKNKEKIDFLFISRNRQVKAKVKSGYLTGDYIFYSVIDELIRRSPECKLHTYIIDDSYAKYYYASLPDIARSMHIASKNFLKWNFYKNGILERLKIMDCNHVASTASYFFHPRLLLRISLMGYSFANMLSMTRPKVIAANDDCVYTRPLNNDAKMVVLQSARMVKYVEECKGFIFEEQDLKPDFYLSSGRKFAELKERFNEAKNVLITGLPRYDSLGNASEIYSKTEFLKNHNVDPNSKIVLWTTQCHVLSDEENTANNQAVFGTIKDLQDITLIIKQHPAEGECYAEIMRRYAEDYQINCLITPKNSDTYELLFISDLVIAKASTTIMEAVALNKPAIILNLSRETDHIEYVQEGVALGIYAKEDLKDGILKLMRPQDDSELHFSRAKYIENYLYKMDGSATDRVVSLLVKLANAKHINHKNNILITE